MQSDILINCISPEHLKMYTASHRGSGGQNTALSKLTIFPAFFPIFSPIFLPIYILSGQTLNAIIINANLTVSVTLAWRLALRQPNGKILLNQRERY